MDLLSTSRLFQDFLAQRRYLKNVTSSTIEWYETAFKALQRTHGVDPAMSKPTLQTFVVSLRKRNVKPISCNTYIKALNAFCRWLHEEGHLAERLELPVLKVEKRILQTLSDDQIRTLLSWKPKTFDQWRLFGLIALTLDTGVRIEEALTLRTRDVDFDNLLLTVLGKGRKERRIPFSFELRKTLFRFQQVRARKNAAFDLVSRAGAAAADARPSWARCARPHERADRCTTAGRTLATPTQRRSRDAPSAPGWPAGVHTAPGAVSDAHHPGHTARNAGAGDRTPCGISHAADTLH